MTPDIGSLIHYHAPNTRSAAIRWLFEELGSPPHETKVLNLSKGEHKSQAYLAIKESGCSFNDFLWKYVDHTPVMYPTPTATITAPENRWSACPRRMSQHRRRVERERGRRA